MGGGVHGDQERLRRFLNREFRQVWAVHRETGERIFLDRGQANAVRETAKREWRCPVPGCEVQISTRGGSRRDHFFHVGEGTGHSDGESEFHLQAKAMIADWASRQGGADTSVREEETVKDPESRVHRRADAMATWVATGRKVAFEVEYKPFTPEAWEKKHREYEQQGIGCVWLFGHTDRYLNLPRRPADWPADQPMDRVRWTVLTQAAAAAGLPVLFVNPVERTIGTLIEDGWPADEIRDRTWWQSPQRYGPRLAVPRDYLWDVDDLPRLVIDELDECVLDPDRGIVTPAMAYVFAERARIEAAAAVEKAKADAREAERSAWRARHEQAEAARKAAERERRRAEDVALAQRCAQMRQNLIAKKGSLPGFLEVHAFDRDVFQCDPQDWTIYLFRELMWPKRGAASPIGRQVTYRGLLYTLMSAGFRETGHGNRSAALREYLLRLWHAGYVDFVTEPNGLILTPITVRADLNADPAPRAVGDSPFPPPPPPPEPKPVKKAPAPKPQPTPPPEPMKQMRTFERDLIDGIIKDQCRRCGHLRGSARCRCAETAPQVSQVDRAARLIEAGVPKHLANAFADLGAEVIPDDEEALSALPSTV